VLRSSDVIAFQLDSTSNWVAICCSFQQCSLDAKGTHYGVQMPPLLHLHKLGHAQASLSQLQHDLSQLNSSGQAMLLCQHTAAWQLVPQHSLAQQQFLQA
jgi:hypothetical protein